MKLKITIGVSRGFKKMIKGMSITSKDFFLKIMLIL